MSRCLSAFLHVIRRETWHLERVCTGVRCAECEETRCQLGPTANIQVVQTLLAQVAHYRRNIPQITELCYAFARSVLIEERRGDTGTVSTRRHHPNIYMLTSPFVAVYQHLCCSQLLFLFTVNGETLVL